MCFFRTQLTSNFPCPKLMGTGCTSMMRTQRYIKNSQGEDVLCHQNDPNMSYREPDQACPYHIEIYGPYAVPNPLC